MGQGAAAKPAARPSATAAPKGTGRSAAAGRSIKREAGMENNLAVHASCLEESRCDALLFVNYFFRLRVRIKMVLSSNVLNETDGQMTSNDSTACTLASQGSGLSGEKKGVPPAAGVKETQPAQIPADELAEEELLAVKMAPQRYMFDGLLSDPLPDSRVGEEEGSSTPLIDGYVDAIVFRISCVNPSEVL